MEEPPFEDMAALVTAVADAMDPWVAEPFAFFGHSMGAGVAFELTRELRRRGKPHPEALIVSGRARRNFAPDGPRRPRLRMQNWWTGFGR